MSVGIVGFGVFVIGAVWGIDQAERFRRRRRYRRADDAEVHLVAARAAGLTALRRLPRERCVEGAHRSWLVHIQDQSYDATPGTRVTVSGIDSTIELRPEDARVHARPAFGARELTLGDPEADPLLFVDGPVERVRALFDAETRRLAARFFHGVGSDGRPWTAPGAAPPTVGLTEGTLSVRLEHDAGPPGEETLTEIVRAGLELAERLQRPPDAVARLAENARQDPCPEVRLLNLRLLLRTHAGDPRTRAVLQAALSDPSAALRLEAALETGRPADAVLVALASGMDTSEDLAVRALEGLADRLPARAGGPIVGGAGAAGRVRVMRAALAALGRAGGPQAVAVLADVVATAREDARVWAAEALGDTREPAAEPVLLALLDRQGPVIVQRAAAEALGRAGSVAAVSRLREIAQDPSWDLVTRYRAEDALTDLQTRVHQVSQGRLSLAEGRGGDLSLAEEAGSLALPDDPTDGPPRG